MLLLSRRYIILHGLIAIICFHTCQPLVAQPATTPDSEDKYPDLATLQAAIQPFVNKFQGKAHIVRYDSQLLVSYKAHTFPRPNLEPKGRLNFQVVYADTKDGPPQIAPALPTRVDPFSPLPADPQIFELAPLDDGFILHAFFTDSQSEVVRPQHFQSTRCQVSLDQVKLQKPSWLLCWNYSYTDKTDPKILAEIKSILRNFGKQN